MPLPQLVKDRLIKRDGLDIAIKKSNEYRVREYVKNYLNDLEETVWILDTLPEKQFKKLFKDEDVYRLLDIANRAAIYLDFLPLQRSEDGRLLALKSLEGIPNNGSPRTFSISREAIDQDKKRFLNLQKHIARLEKFVQPTRGVIYNNLDKTYFNELAMTAKKAGYCPAKAPEIDTEGSLYLPKLTPEQRWVRQVQANLIYIGFDDINSREDLKILQDAMITEEGKALIEKFRSMQAEPPSGA